MLRLAIALLIICCWAIPAVAEPTTFDGQHAMQHIANQLAFGPRTPEHQQAKQQTLEYIQQQLTPLSDSVVTQSFSVYNLQGTNLWASFNGKKDAKQRLLFGAHWDSRLHADKDPEVKHRHKPVLGANDGASGVAVLLELARILSISPPPVTVDLVFFDLEDMGDIDGRPYAIGASQFVINNPNYRPQAGIIVDMVCDKNLSIPRELYSQTRARSLMDKLWDIAKQQQATAFKNRRGQYILDDHLPFLDAGLNVVDFIHYPFPDYWHTTADTIDKCSASSLRQVGDVLSAFTYSYY